MGKHGRATLEQTEPLTFTVEDSQELYAIIDAATRAKQYADAMIMAGKLQPSAEAYWTAVDFFVAGWAARDELKERHG